MQAIAREFNLSETTFPYAAPEGRDLRPADLHAGDRAALRRPPLGRVGLGPAPAGPDRRRRQRPGLRCRSAPGARVGATSALLTGGTPTVTASRWPRPFFEALGLTSRRPGRCRAAMGRRRHRRGASCWSGPRPWPRSAPDVRRVAALGGTGISLVAWDGAVARCRVFAGGAGVPEDPATGSAALALGVYLHAAGLLGDGEHSYVVEQGYEMGRPSTLRCTVAIADGAVTRTTVAGSVVPIAEARSPSRRSIAREAEIRIHLSARSSRSRSPAVPRRLSRAQRSGWASPSGGFSRFSCSTGTTEAQALRPGLHPRDDRGALDHRVARRRLAAQHDDGRLRRTG